MVARADRRWFNQLFTELSVELGRLAPRYALWLRIGELGLDPSKLERRDVFSFCELHLPAFLADHDLALSARSQRKLVKSLRGFDPRRQTPEEQMARILAPRG